MMLCIERRINVLSIYLSIYARIRHSDSGRRAELGTSTKLSAGPRFCFESCIINKYVPVEISTKDQEYESLNFNLGVQLCGSNYACLDIDG